MAISPNVLCAILSVSSSSDPAGHLKLGNGPAFFGLHERLDIWKAASDLERLDRRLASLGMEEFPDAGEELFGPQLVERLTQRADVQQPSSRAPSSVGCVATESGDIQTHQEGARLGRNALIPFTETPLISFEDWELPDTATVMVLGQSAARTMPSQAAVTQAAASGDPQLASAAAGDAGANKDPARGIANFVGKGAACRPNWASVLAACARSSIAALGKGVAATSRRPPADLSASEKGSDEGPLGVTGGPRSSTQLSRAAVSAMPPVLRWLSSGHAPALADEVASLLMKEAGG